MTSSLFKTLFAVSTLAVAAQAAAQVTFYEDDAFKGRSFNSQKRVGNFERSGSGFDNRASSVIVVGQRWEVCEETHFEGRCTVLRPGQYPTLSATGLNDRISSARPLDANERVADADYAPLPVVAKDYRRGRNERLFDADVTSARAVVGTPGQRCWMEPQQVAQQQQQPQPVTANLNLGGAAIGAVIGGILGNQVGGGSGKKIATVGGALGGAALGSQVGRNSVSAAAPPTVTQDVRRCDSNPVEAKPSYWDVTYEFRGVEHRVQMVNQPGRTIIVNDKGEPRA